MTWSSKRSRLNRGTVPTRLQREIALARREIRQGRFERSMGLMTAFAAIVSGWEAYAQHPCGGHSPTG